MNGTLRYSVDRCVWWKALAPFCRGDHHGVGAGRNTKFSCDATSGGPVILDDFHYDKYTLSNGQLPLITNNCTGIGS